MRILYGVVGEGMGHATRSRVVLEHLLAQGHEIRVVVSGRAHQFLSTRLQGRPHLSVHEIRGLHLVYDENSVDKSASLWSNLKQAGKSFKINLEVRREVLGSFEADVVISDFESWAYFFGRSEGLPVISIDNMQVLNRCQHPPELLRHPQVQADFQLAKLAVKAKLPGAWHYLITSFFFPPIRKPRTTLIPPILRPEILAARPEPHQHILVYQTASASTALLPLLKRLPYEFRVYGMGRDGQEGNVKLCAFSETGFIDDLRQARAVIAGGGFSLMGEAVHLGVPMLSHPIESQYEQILNADYLEHLGYGQHARHLDENTVAQFLARIDVFAEALSHYPRAGSETLYACVNELLGDVAAGRRKDRLDTPCPGAWDPGDGPSELREILER